MLQYAAKLGYNKQQQLKLVLVTSGDVFYSRLKQTPVKFDGPIEFLEPTLT
jgi:hypothetical protein